MQSYRSTTAAILVTMFLCSGCAMQNSEPTPPGALEQVNYTPFHSALWSREGTGNYTARLTVRFDVTQGATRLSQNQPDVDLEQEIPQSCALPSGAPDFQRSSRMVILPGAHSSKKQRSLLIDGAKRAIPAGDGCVVMESPVEGYFREGSSIELREQTGAPFRFVLPPTFMPFLLVRYHQGDMLPSPMRADLVVIDPASSTVDVTYRSTFPLRPAVRKVEFRLITSDNPPWPGETAEQAAHRQNRSLQYLRDCAVPPQPPEPCSVPGVRPDPAFFQAP